jgi:uncharacterized protein YceH (UPF0502 family)
VPRTLTPYEIRVIAALIEKEITTPDQYPLSLNALTSACNQKSNRDPVLNLSEQTVQETLDGLSRKYLVSPQSGYGSRVTKYKHRFCNTDFGDFRLSPQELGILCELMLRGPQTPGELRIHAERLCPLGDVEEAERTLAALMAREEPLVARLPREPGKREHRYAHLLGDEAPPPAATDPAETAAGTEPDRLAILEARVQELGEEVAELKRKLAVLTEALGA